MASNALADTADFQPGPKTANAPCASTTNVEVRIGGASHRGKVRPNNEDCYLIARFARSLHTVLTNVPDDYTLPSLNQVGYSMVVADGMGGAAAGEVASRSAVESLTKLIQCTRDWIFADDDAHLELVMARMAERFSEVDRMLVQKASANPAFKGMGTTLTLACSLGLDLILCHIGDSRAYLLRDGALRQLTRDMTVAQGLIDAGLLDPTEKAAHRLRHALTQCIGQGHVSADVQRHVLRDGDRLLLCSDGLTDMVGDEEIANLMRGVATPEEACNRLIQHALQAGGHDNVTIVIADYRVS